MSFTALTSHLFSTDGMRQVFAPQASVQRMLDVEAALAAALAAEGLIPASAVAPIRAACDASRYDLDALAAAALPAGNLAIPLVKQLTAEVAAMDADAARYVHWGATSQDVIDTGLVLQLREAIDLISVELGELADALAGLVHRHRDTAMIGRTWMQHALPITFGLKAAGWLDAVMRHQQRLHELRARIAVLQFGGAAGTLASLGDRGLSVASALAQKPRFPGLLSMFARLGEQTGRLPEMLQRGADQLSAEVQRRAMQLATILEPLLIVAMGAVVMLIVLAVLLPIIQLNTWVR